MGIRQKSSRGVFIELWTQYFQVSMQVPQICFTNITYVSSIWTIVVLYIIMPHQFSTLH